MSGKRPRAAKPRSLERSSAGPSRLIWMRAPSPPSRLLREIVEAYNQEMGTTFNVAGFLADRQLHPTGLRCGAGGFASGRGAWRRRMGASSLTRSGRLQLRPDTLGICDRYQLLRHQCQDRLRHSDVCSQGTLARTLLDPTAWDLVQPCESP